MKTTLLIFLSLALLSLNAQVFEGTPYSSALSGHTCTGISLDEFLVCGGIDDIEYLNTASVYNVGSNEWTSIEPMNFVRHNHRAMQLNEAFYLVTGGWNGIDSNQNSTEIYNYAFDSWGAGPDMSTGRSDHTMTRLQDGTILILGGFDGFENTTSADIYDPVTNMLWAVEDMNFGRSAHTATLLNDGRVLVVGGFNPDFGFQMNSCEIYDPFEDSWANGPSLTVGRDNHAALLLGTNEVLVSGGRSFNGALNLFEGLKSTIIFNPSTDTWSDGEDLPNGQSFHDMWLINDQVVVIGGADQTGFEVTTTFSNTATKANEFSPWTEEGLYQAQGRYLAASSPSGDLDNSLIDYIFVVGGENNLSTEVYYSPLLIEESNQFNAYVYPNPSSDFIQIKNLNYSVEYDVTLFDALGRIIKNWSSISADHRLDIQGLKKGVYSLKVNEESRSYVIRLSVN